MKKVVAVALLVAMILTVSPLAAHAHGGAVAAALALGAFATFSILTAPFWALAAYPAYPYPGPYYPPATYYAPSYSALPAQPVASYSAPAYSAPAPTTPAVQREVIYPHGRHVLYGDGVTTAYRWVWLPNPPQPPAPAFAPPPVAAGPPPPPPTR